MMMITPAMYIRNMLRLQNGAAIEIMNTKEARSVNGSILLPGRTIASTSDVGISSSDVAIILGSPIRSAVSIPK